MKIIVIGGTGTIGKEVVKELSERHEVITAGHKSGDVKVDIEDISSIEKLYEENQNIDAVVMTTGKVKFHEMTGMKNDDYQIGLRSKLMGQVNVVLAGLKHLNDNGSFTLTSGVLNHDPILYGSSASMVNGAIDGFVIGAAIEMPRGIRINVVSPTVITESMENYAPYFRGYEPVTAAKAAMLYSKSVEGRQTGQVYKAGY